MLPSLKEGDIVFFKKYIKHKSMLKKRQIVIFNHPLKNKILIKRIYSVNQNKVMLLGDNIGFSEDSNKFGLVNNEKIIGIVTSRLVIPKLINFLIQKNISTPLNPK
tara:strand:+ start:158 stop:475 length:318 start_codon:yes stop_codon:yes gene_type:complete